MSVDTRTTDHDIVNNREATLTADPLSLAVLESTVGQDSSLVEVDASAVLCSGERKLIRVEELPHGPIDDLVGRVAKNVDYGVGRVKNVGIVGQVWRGRISGWGLVVWCLVKRTVDGDEGGIHGGELGCWLAT